MEEENEKGLEKLICLQRKTYERFSSSKLSQRKQAFLRKFYPLIIGKWKDDLPNFTEHFTKDEIDWFLTLDVHVVCDTSEATIIELTIRTGYKDEPKIDADGKPVTRCSTQIHRLAQIDHAKGSRQIRSYTNIPKLFRIYDKFDVNYADETGLTHFHVACIYSCYHTMEKFLEAGQDPDCKWPKTGDTPLHMVMSDDSERGVELLLRAGADPNATNNNGSTPLHMICNSSAFYKDRAKMLFEISAERNKPVLVNARNRDGNTALHLAAKKVNKKAIELLLAQGADPNLPNFGGMTALHILSDRTCTSELVDMLITVSERKCRPVQINARESLHGNTPLHLALMRDKEEVAELLMRKGADVNATNNEGWTPLHMICKNCNSGELAKKFFAIIDDIELKIEIDAPDNKGRTPLQWAVANHVESACRVLLDRGADLSKFTFPTADYFAEGIDLAFAGEWTNLKLAIGSSALSIAAFMEDEGYEFTRDDAMTIMGLFAKHGLFQKQEDRESYWYEDGEFQEYADEWMANSCLSVNDLLQMEPDQLEGELTYTALYNLACRGERMPQDLTDEWAKSCSLHLCETMARGFFRRWTLDCFWNMTRRKLPLECCEMIMQPLMNEDLYNICLAAEE